MMEARMYGVRSAAPAPLTPAGYRLRALRLLQAAQNHGAIENPEAFLDSQGRDLARLIGGNTACIALRSDPEGPVVILDAGSGLVSLGRELMQGEFGQGRGEAHILLTHIHLDRISGLAQFAPLYTEGNQIHFHYPEDNLELRLIRLLSPPYHELALDTVPATLHFHCLSEAPLDQKLRIGDIELDYTTLLHPGTSYAYRLTAGRSVLVYAGAGKMQESFEQEESPLRRFLDRANALFLDAVPGPPSSDERLRNWGHTDYEAAIHLAQTVRAEHLFFFNHPPDWDDAALWQAFGKAKETLRDCPLRIHLAREGQRIQVGRA